MTRLDLLNTTASFRRDLLNEAIDEEDDEETTQYVEAVIVIANGGQLLKAERIHT
ncbi:MAG: hypothetical protein CM15mV106_080 [uncultured marine virus]|nr:MAG: hypothetical protein CM15mV106_080 [uncultured marine virus]